jgi:hypothetical protein
MKFYVFANWDESLYFYSCSTDDIVVMGIF